MDVLKVEDIAKLIGGNVKGDKSLQIKSIAGIEDAKEGDLTFLRDKKLSLLEKTKASCIIVSNGLVEDIGCLRGKTIIEVKDPMFAFVKVLKIFQEERLPSCGISKNAKIEKGVSLGKNISIGDFVYIGENSVIKDDVIIYPNSYLGKGVEVGKRSVIFPNVTILDKVKIGDRVIIQSGAVVGSDGFGYIKRKGKNLKIPHLGCVVIEDDVEIGANTTIARATIGSTIIKRGIKIDNLVYIAHNVVIDENCVIVGQSGIAGSTRIGKNVEIGGQVGITDHIEIGDGVKIGGQSGVTKSIKSGMIVSGYPAREHTSSKKAYALLARLPELFKRVKILEENAKDD